MKIQEIINIIADALEIEGKHPDSNGIYHFSFENDIDISVIPISNKTHILYGNICKIDNTSLSYSIIDECAKIAVSVFKIKNSIVFLEDNYISLYSIVKNEQQPLEYFSQYMKAFIYDMNWWKQKLGNDIKKQEIQNINPSTWISG